MSRRPKNNGIRSLALVGIAVVSMSACGSDGTTKLTGPEPDPDGTFAVATLACSEGAKLTDAFTAASALTRLMADHEVSSDYDWDVASATLITLSGSSIDAGGSAAVAINGTVATITAAGTYLLRGMLTDGQIMVNATGVVKLVLDGASITSSNNSPIAFAAADRAVVILAAGSTNVLKDGSTYPSGADQNSALYSKGNMSIGGEGALSVTAQFKHGINSKGGLVVRNGNITVNAVDDGIRGKDYLVVRGGQFTVTAGSDAFKGDREGTENRGYILVSGGSGTLSAANDGMQAESDLLLTGGNYTITTRDGSSSAAPEDVSAKALKAERDLVIDGGTYSINAADDGVHSNTNVVINGGTVTVATADDGIHADQALTINGGTIDITKSYEGLESGTADLTINGGNIRVVSSDDGVNLAGDGDAAPGTRPGDYTMRITGGRLVVNAAGDGLDANGAIMMTGGCAFVHGPTANNNAAIDYDGTFTISGGVLVAAGSAGMAQAPGTSSSQGSAQITFSRGAAAGTIIHLAASTGTSLIDFAPAKSFQSLVISAPGIERGLSYTLYSGGSISTTAVDGVYESGRYTPGSSSQSFTQSAITTRVSF